MARSAATREQVSRPFLRRAAESARRLYTSARNSLKSRGGKTLHHELAWWPVVASLVIMLIGSIATSAWLAYQSISDRKKLLLAFAQFAENDLEMSQRHVFSQVQDLAGRWEGVLGLTTDPERRAELIDHTRTGNRPEKRGKQIRPPAAAGEGWQGPQGGVDGATNRPVLAELQGQHYSTVLGSSPDVDGLTALLNDGKPVGISVRQFPAVNDPRRSGRQPTRKNSRRGTNSCSPFQSSRSTVARRTTPPHGRGGRHRLLASLPEHPRRNRAKVRTSRP